MADAKGSSSGGGGGVGRGDFVGGAPHRYQALLAAVHTPGPGAPNVHQYRAGLIHPPVAMPVPMPPPYVPPQLAAPPPLVPPPQHRAQSHLPPGSYRDWTASNNNVPAQQVPRGFADWAMYDSAFMPLDQAAGFSNNSNHADFDQNLTPCSTTTWPNYMLRNHCYSAYPPAMEDHRAPSFHNNNHEKDSGFATGFRVDPSVVSASPFPPMSPAPSIGSSAQIFNEATYTQEVRNSEDPRVFGSDMDSENSDEVDHTPVGEPPSLNLGHESWTARFNCREYRLVLRKDLTKSDVGNIGRIVLPKRDAEASLPALLDREGVILKMDDFKLPATWNFKYRFWPNNKSRMYILETTGEFVKSHGLQTGDILIIYKSSESGRLVVRGEKAIQQNAPVPCLECSCKKEGNNSKECRFAMSLKTKRT